MSKFCGKCGNQLPDDAKICGYCGCVIEQPAVPVESEVKYQYDAPQQPVAPSGNIVSSVKNTANGLINKMKNDKKFMFMVIGIGAGTFTVILALILVLCLGGGYKKPIDNYLDAVQGDYDAYIDSAPESYWDKEDSSFLDEYEFEERFEDTFDYYSDFDIDYEVLSKTEIEGSDFSDLKNSIVDEWDVSRKDIEKAYSLQVLFCTETDDLENYDVNKFIVVKVDGDWYAYNWGTLN